MTQNAKNRLDEWLRSVGHRPETVRRYERASDPATTHHASLSVALPGFDTVTGTGAARRATDAEIVAAEAVFQQIEAEHPEWLVDWDALRVEAQAGDALLKLAVYSHEAVATAETRSRVLQQIETNHNLADRFAEFRTSEPWLRIFGDDLGQERAATLSEVVLWRRFGERIIDENARVALKQLLGVVVPPTE